jgi:two-component system KDP operon response regulator KdpE
MTDPAVILVVEDEPHARALLLVTLKHEGYLCLHESTGFAAIATVRARQPAVVLLDLGLPDLDGVEVTRRIRAESAVPIIVVSARGKDEQKVLALDSGANDYLTKPYSTAELFARIRVVLRDRRQETVSPETGTVAVGDLRVDFDARRVTVGGADVYLTPIEYRLLGVMIRSAGRVLSSRQILSQVWGPRHDDQPGYLRVYMKKLRYKIEHEPARPRYLVNEPGVGYRFRVPD